MADAIRVGLVGASATPGWSSIAHIPGIEAASGIELAAVCTSRPSSAAAAAEAYGVPGYHDVDELVSNGDVDVVSVVVRVPKHHELVLRAINAGAHVFSEWPLGANLAEASEMAEKAGHAGVITGVGLQAQHDPTLNHIRRLIADGWLGRVVAVDASSVSGGALSRRAADAWMGDRRNGANPLTIVGGHMAEAITFCAGEFVNVAATVGTQFAEWHLDDTSETIAVDAPDSVLVNGVLEGGAAASLRVSSVPFHGSGWRMTIHGTEGTIVATTSGLPQITPIRLQGARGADPLVDLALPDDLVDGFPDGPAGNVGRGYERLGEAIRHGRPFDPGFSHAQRRHRLIDAIERSSDDGVQVRLD